jgi:cyclohexa-1,5-dienecarbonyl-CoA hydratase
VTNTPTAGPIRVEVSADGALRRIFLSAPKANVLDAKMIEALTTTFQEARTDRNLKAVIVEGEGPHFSFGASVEEHLPGAVDSMLPGFHAMFRAMLECGVFLVAAVRGQCLGGGLELASFCHRVFAAPDAKLGQPEIALGVFAPVASLVLPMRVGQPSADDLCATGRVIGAEAALSMGLVDEVDDDPANAALAWAEKRLLPKSASSLRIALQAVRGPFHRTFLAELDRVEKLYLDDLMQTKDAREGLASFLEKRKPAWSNS